jgi:exodeoxyribonuclease V alpha subunit
MKYVQGIIKVIIYHNEESMYTILKIEVTDYNEKTNLFLFDDGDYLTITGYFPSLMRGEEIRFFGSFHNHDKYGLQYQVKSYEKLSDTTTSGVIEYLSSDLFPGIGIKTAERIVNKLGKKAIENILKDKTVLDHIDKLSSKQKEVIYNGLMDNKAMENTLIQLYSYGITPNMAIKIFKFYQNDALSILEQNPYQLIQDIEGIGFERADHIAKLLGFSDTHPLRIKAMILYLYQLMGLNYGHTFLYKEQLIQYLKNALNKKNHLVEESNILTYLNELIDEGIFVQVEDRIQHVTVYNSMKTIVKTIGNFSVVEPMNVDINKASVFIRDFEKREQITYTKKQRKAILKALENNLFLLTGGPGTGKTTVIKGLVYTYCKYFHLPIQYDNPLFSVKLVAPTGRAAKRMKESTGLHSETIHRFLGYSYDGTFEHNKNNLVSAQMIIIDEASMIDVFLASQLLQSIPTSTKVVIVGDEDQLPSVGPGQVLKDLLDTNLIESVRLDRIHRQETDSHIIDLAYYINQGIIPKDIKKVYEDRLFIEETPKHFKDRLISSLYYVDSLGVDVFTDVQILIPMYRGSTGIDAVNQIVQNEFNKENGKSVQHNNRVFRYGDKVIQLVNQVEDGVMNGDQGIVVGITDEDHVIVSFDQKEVLYKKGDLVNLKHSYAMSIHKSQGSEYEVVILPLFKSYSIMLKRKLLYTAITRAKKKLILIGELSSFEYGVKNVEDERQSTLKEDIIFEILHKTSKMNKVEITPSNNEIKIDDPMIPFDTFGEDIGDVSPYDFLEKNEESN